MSLSECLGLEILVFEVCSCVIERDDQGVDMELRMKVNEGRDENDEEEEVSTFEDMNYIVDTFEYEVDVAVNLEGTDFDPCGYYDDPQMLVLEGDDGDVGRVHEWECGKMIRHVGLGSFDIDKSGQLGFAVLLL